jgi:arsenate reductase
MKKPKVLFVCIHNSARSQMAEALVNHLCGHQLEAESAGLEPGNLNPLAVEAMRKMGVDISGAQTKSVFEKFKQAEHFAYVVTVCDETSGERCPIFPGAARRIHWSFPDPSSFQGSWEEKVAKTIEVRDLIADQIRQWCPTVCLEAELCGTPV